METCNTAPVRYLLAAARFQAARAGLTGADAQDCALSFAEKHIAASPPPGTRCREAWLNCYARHHAADYRRALCRRRGHECPWPEAAGPDGSPAPFDPPGDAPAPGAALLHDECGWEIVMALRDLGEVTREIWMRHALSGEPVASIAQSAGKSSEAVRKIISRAGKHVEASLLRVGWTREDVCQCLLPREQ